MCGRFTLSVDPAESGEDFDGFRFPEKFAPRYNIAPTQAVLAIPNDNTKAADFLLWGLIPSWAKDASIGSRLINARGETLGEKPAFRGAYKYHRCLIPADGFYEWKAETGTSIKIPHVIRFVSHKPFAFAGLWDAWDASDGSPVRSCTIITTGPNSLMAPIHNRMPLILTPGDFAEWLDPDPRTPASLNHLIRPLPSDQMEAFAVSTLVNDPRHDQRECMLPA